MDIQPRVIDSTVKPVGLIDWLTLMIPADLIAHDDRTNLQNRFNEVMEVTRQTPTQDQLDTYYSENGRGRNDIYLDPKSGEYRCIAWKSSARESIRSDTHSINIHLGEFLQISGSPSRVMFLNNVFGTLDIQFAALKMIDFVNDQYNLWLPVDLNLWNCTRIDITQNFALNNIAEVQEVTHALKNSGTANRKVISYPTSVIFVGRNGKPSRLHVGVVYQKGAQALDQIKKKTSSYTDEELKKAQLIQRFEYKMKSSMLSRLYKTSGIKWQQFTPEILIKFHNNYFSSLLSSIEVTTMDDVLISLQKITTAGRAASAYSTYIAIKHFGFIAAKAQYNSSGTWNNRISLLKKIGLTEADLQASNITPLRRKPIILSEPVSSWDQIKLASGV